VKNNINGTSAQVDPSSFVSTTGEGRLVAVRAVDVAGNLGELSQGKCVMFVPTVGFCDVFDAMGGDCDAGGCSVTAPGKKARDAAPLGLVVLGCAVAVARRRRKSA
jgi:hypothetical protein